MNIRRSWQVIEKKYDVCLAAMKNGSLPADAQKRRGKERLMPEYHLRREICSPGAQKALEEVLSERSDRERPLSADERKRMEKFTTT